MLHPALREKGRAIVPPSLPSSASPIHQRPPPPIAAVPILESRDQIIRPGPIPGMRPPLGGPGHVVPPPPRGSGTMGIVMPLYTMGIVIFFVYTMMKVLFKKSEDVPKYRELGIDPEFHHMIFQPNEGIPRRAEEVAYSEGDTLSYSNGCPPLEKKVKAHHREITREGGTKLAN
ncbi:hypothetical protein J437_LFUL014059 [Ladona fulva]|uniref:Resistance to inhibitors of cholinesterase protein 3 N-terminal domain-containing protein n=1 Tax=Ladona fulva TaxID=123851 RepID=A0A8K0KTX6_LADFU|nr:hypothetical protein J437_LFUL014059 [Ladona fulva]